MTADPPSQPAEPQPRLVLASQSPRRTSLLTRHGVRHEVMPPRLEDSELQSGHVDAPMWAAALAYVKAADVARQLCEFLHDRRAVTVLGADTVVVSGRSLIGKPASADDAREMIRRLQGGEHEVVTGVALIDAHTGERHLLSDTATVHVGVIDHAEIDRYVASGDWRGKAGGYNLDERVAAGWPVTCIGDPGTVMGLPMRKLLPLLEMFRTSSAT